MFKNSEPEPSARLSNQGRYSAFLSLYTQILLSIWKMFTFVSKTQEKMNPWTIQKIGYDLANNQALLFSCKSVLQTYANLVNSVTCIFSLLSPNSQIWKGKTLGENINWSTNPSRQKLIVFIVPDASKLESLLFSCWIVGSILPSDLLITGWWSFAFGTPSLRLFVYV